MPGAPLQRRLLLQLLVPLSRREPRQVLAYADLAQIDPQRASVAGVLDLAQARRIVRESAPQGRAARPRLFL